MYKPLLCFFLEYSKPGKTYSQVSLRSHALQILLLTTAGQLRLPELQENIVTVLQTFAMAEKMHFQFKVQLKLKITETTNKERLIPRTPLSTRTKPNVQKTIVTIIVIIYKLSVCQPSRKKHISRKNVMFQAVLFYIVFCLFKRKPAYLPMCLTIQVKMMHSNNLLIQRTNKLIF